MPRMQVNYILSRFHYIICTDLNLQTVDITTMIFVDIFLTPVFPLPVSAAYQEKQSSMKLN